MSLPAVAAWKNASNTLAPSRPGDVDATKKAPLGTIATFRDITYGEGEFIYLAGATSMAAGDLVTYDAAFVAVRAVAGNVLPRAVALATAAVDSATEYGWFQIGGQGIANKTKTVSMAAGIAVGCSTTALVIHSSSLKELQGCLVAVVASATTTTNNGGKVVLMINRPHFQGRIT
jgi:hypothetical protein